MAGVLKIGIKLGIVGGSIYYTNRLGVWSDSSHSERIYKEVHGIIAPYIQDVPIEVPELPRITDVTSTVKNYWNYAVLGTGKFLLDLPQMTSSLMKDGYKTVLNQLNSSTGSP